MRQQLLNPSTDTDVGVSEGLFKGVSNDPVLSAGGGIATFRKEKVGVAVSAGWATGFVAGDGIDTDTPNPKNAVVAPPNKHWRNWDKHQSSPQIVAVSKG